MGILSTLHIFQEFHELNCFLRSNDDLPAWHFRFQIALQNGYLTRQNQLTVLDLACDILLLEEFGDGA